MRTVVLWALLAAGLVTAAVAGMPDRNDALRQRAQTHQPIGADNGLIALSTVVEGKYQQVTLIDSASRVMSVYHIDLASGSVKLCCVRNFRWDLQMLQHNGESPLPREIRSLLEPM
jgi:hypothetical protein